MRGVGYQCDHCGTNEVLAVPLDLRHYESSDAGFVPENWIVLFSGDQSTHHYCSWACVRAKADARLAATVDEISA